MVPYSPSVKLSCPSNPVRTLSLLYSWVLMIPEGKVVVTCNQSIKEEAEALLSHFGIYFEVVFGFVVWEAFTDPYRTSMKIFQYCPLENRAVERTTATDSSTIAIYDSDNSFDRDFAKWGLTEDLQEVLHEIESNFTYQVSLHVGANICGILGNINGDSSTIRSNLSDVTLPTSKSALPTPINYLESSQTTISPVIIPILP